MLDLRTFKDQISEKGFFFQDSVFSPTDTEVLKKYAEDLKEMGQFRPALIGTPLSLQKIPLIRGDEIHWIENWDNPLLKELNEIYQQVIHKSKTELFLSIKRFESHFSHYVSGTHYARHVDQHKENRHRILSSVLYLSHWEDSNSGELYIYPENSEKVIIKPLPGRLIVFRSDFEHEVKPTKADRWSIATWLRDDI